MKTYPRVLTIAGSDSGGGAGIQADLKTFSALGCYGMSVITALTAQNTLTVKSIHPIPPEFVAAQMDAVLEDIGTDSVKIGMLHSAEVVEIVVDRLKKYKCKSIVLDPVMVATSGDKLFQDDAVATLKEKLLPMASIITPNLSEASILLNRPILTVEDMPQACLELAELGCKNVLLKGGHLSGNQISDFLYLGDGCITVRLDGKKIDTKNSHGTGCTLSSAIAVNLAKGENIPSSVKKAKIFLSSALTAGAKYKIGHGNGPVYWNH